MLRHTMFSLSNGYNVLSPYDYNVLSSFIAFVLLINYFEYSPTQLFVSSGYYKLFLFLFHLFQIALKEIIIPVFELRKACIAPCK